MKAKFVLVFCSLIALGACTESPPPSLNSKDREKIDSLFKLHVKDLKAETDSICESRHDSLLEAFTDSIMAIRKFEIERQLQRIRQLEQ